MKGNAGMPNPGRLFSALTGIVGESGVIRDPDRLEAYAVDGRAPKAVVRPGTEGEVAGVVRYANAERLAIVPRGNGGMMACGGIPRNVDIVLSLLRLDRVVDYDVANMSLSVEAGITLADVQRKLADGGRGNFLPLDPPRVETATIGGIVAANASGPKRYLYGTVRDLLLGLRAVLPEGDIVSFGGKNDEKRVRIRHDPAVGRIVGGAGNHHRGHDEAAAASGGLGHPSGVVRCAGRGGTVHSRDPAFGAAAIRRRPGRRECRGATGGKREIPGGLRS